MSYQQQTQKEIENEVNHSVTICVECSQVVHTHRRHHCDQENERNGCQRVRHDKLGDTIIAVQSFLQKDLHKMKEKL